MIFRALLFLALAQNAMAVDPTSFYKVLGVDTDQLKSGAEFHQLIELLGEGSRGQSGDASTGRDWMAGPSFPSYQAIIVR